MYGLYTFVVGRAGNDRTPRRASEHSESGYYRAFALQVSVLMPAECNYRQPFSFEPKSIDNAKQ